ncbi:unnamed protein product [Hyaloperonospora brassicae]|uniref:EF-hand domain-containing protein n=1 Tax=Hyaloperonospora brassicae TaxID=162125 RepID=A0AAV0SZM6_HYABA|nr:unnamed protein product [Hyaloperonospora brassicae]
MRGSVVPYKAAARCAGRRNAFAPPQWLRAVPSAASGTALERSCARQFRRRSSAAVSTLGIATLALAGTALGVADGDAVAHAEAQGRTGAASFGSEEREKARTGRTKGRRLVLQQRRKHEAETEQEKEFKMHLSEYRALRKAMDSLRARFDMFASGSVETNDGQRVRAMTFTDFLHSLVLAQFHVHSPPSLVYSCDFVGNADGLIAYEEWCLLIHLLQIPKKQFALAFCMFDLDGDGSVNQTQFCAAIEHLLRTTNGCGGGEERPSVHPFRRIEMPVSVENALPRLITLLFGRYRKKITAEDLTEALDVLCKKILRAEFDLSATRDPLAKQQTMTVHDFALTLISHLDPDKLPPYLERVQALNASDDVVTWNEFCTFHFTVRSYLRDIELACELTKAQEITEADFIRAARIVSGVELSFPVVQLAFHIFHNADGALDRSELFKALEMRNTVQLTQMSNKRSRLEKLWRCVIGDDSHRW